MVLILMLGAMVFGIVGREKKLVPWPPNNRAFHMARCLLGMESACGSWSIGIYEGNSPLELSAPSGVACPVLTADDIHDIDARFVADPFLFTEENTFYLFFEIYNEATRQGDIGYAESADGLSWTYKSRVIDEPFHLSYPGVFKWEGNYYLIPESSEDLSIRLYRAVSFPERWEHIATLCSGFRFVDPTVVRHNDRWWIFAGSPGRDALNCFHSDDLLKGWRPHPMNPLVKFDRKLSSPAGGIVSYDGRLYRMAQDCRKTYGRQVFAVEITELTETSYAERLARDEPIATASGKGWNATGMHHVDVHRRGDRWMAAIDGRGW